MLLINEDVECTAVNGVSTVTDGMTLINTPSSGAEMSRLLTVRLLKVGRSYTHILLVSCCCLLGRIAVQSIRCGLLLSMYVSNNNNNNDRLTAFDPGQPG